MSIEGILGRKLGTTQVFDAKGRLRGVTAVEVGPCFVTQIRTPEADGYSAIQIGFQDDRKLNKPEAGHLKAAGNLKLRYGVDGNYKGHTSGGAVGTQAATAAYAVYNARIGIGNADESWSVTLWSRNVFDKYYYPAAYQGGNGPFIRSVGMPRTVGLMGEMRF